MQKIHIAVLTVAAFAVPVAANAQAYPPTASQIESDLTQPDDTQLRVDIGIGSPGAPDRIVKVIMQRELTAAFTPERIAQIGESASQGIQNGANTISSASTSLVTKSMSSILGVAEEAGAISSSSSGSTTTLTANVPQFFRYLEPSGKPCFVISNTCSLGGMLVRGASASVSLNTSKSSMPSETNLSTAALAGITGVQNPVFTSFTFQETFHGRKNGQITQPDFQGAINKIASDKVSALLTAYLNIVNKLTSPANGNDQLVSRYADALRVCVTALKNARNDDARVQTAEDGCVNSFADIVQSIPEIDGLLTTLTQAQVAYNTARDQALTQLFYRSTFSVEYDLTDNLNQPTLSTVKGIYGYGSKSRAFQVTANGSTSLYNSLGGSSESRLRSAQGSFQLDYQPGTTPKLQAAYSVGYYFQYMVANGLINLPSTAFAPGTTIALPSNASVLLNTTGPIHIGQGKITLSIKGTNIKIPLAITGASRTDLIKANRVSGNFGISYDFSSLVSK